MNAVGNLRRCCYTAMLFVPLPLLWVVGVGWVCVAVLLCYINVLVKNYRIFFIIANFFGASVGDQNELMIWIFEGDEFRLKI